MTDTIVPKRDVATLGGGCFWCLEAVYDEIEGVISVESGYAGGHKPNPTYEEVCTGRTGHAEVVQITFDPQVITFRDLLDIFSAFTTRPRPTVRAPTSVRSTVRSFCITTKISAGLPKKPSLH